MEKAVSKPGARGDMVVWTVAAAATLVASIGVIGADALWLVPLGDRIAHGHLPGSIFFASGPTGGWHDVPAAAELLFWAAYHSLGGDRGVVVAQAAAAAIGFGALAWGLRRDASSGTVATVSVVVLAGSLPAVAVAGVSLFSLALFPVLLALVEAESRAPSRRVWLAVPLLAVWGNLHGGALVGLGLLACYLVFSRARLQGWIAVGVLAASAAVLCLTPALWRTPLYYKGVFDSEPAQSGEGLWKPLGFGGFGLLLIAAAVTLAVCALARGPREIPVWEAVAALGLTAATVHVARNGVFLLLVLAYPAARGLRLREIPRRWLVSATLALGALALLLVVRGPLDPGSQSLARMAAASREPVLAGAVLGQQVVLAGGRIWVGNPIDAFRRSDQRLYLDWLEGLPSGELAVSRAHYVLVDPGSAAGRYAANDRRLKLVVVSPGAALYRVTT